MTFQEALRRAEGWLDEFEGVEGVGEGRAEGERCITVFVSLPEAVEKIPDRLGDHRVVVELSGPFQIQAE